MGIIQKIKKGIVNRTSDVLAYPLIVRSKRMSRQADADIKALKAGRGLKGKEVYPANESNPAFRAQMNAEEVRFRRRKGVTF